MVTALIVEDNDLFRKCAIKALTLKGYDMKGAINGKDGLDILASSGNIDIIFVDYQMPIMDGYDFVNAIKNNPDYANHSKVPIIGIGDFPDDKRGYLKECREKMSFQMADLGKLIEQYCG